ncbi:MAG TPA: acetyl-CoA carboxylase biotin carboxyl carrier protein [Bacteroidetes bacterium]|jgi:acetyl-CoA carboxylase biotin carboxyl carrier protein|nr:MAG: acetyl-CoA carboxylase biotin carboxyl carrier protein subunit [Sphingobacteriales bacterium BACL12 MAG-120813-bin55]HCK21140.1 acetyl-CoA carboxylase biotin carboxyl carrier protein [Bacteroidota bacterium]
MDFKQIQELIKLVSKSGISEVSIETEEMKVKVKGNLAYGPQTNNAQPVFIPQPIQTSVESAAPVSKAPAPAPAPSSGDESEAPKKEANSNLITFKSPIVGTFYRSSGPDKEPFVKVGDEISVGDVLCIIEAMKLFNEIESEHNGKIVKILIDDASPVEFEQPLFLIEPR